MKKSVKLLSLAAAIAAMSCCILQTNAQSANTVQLEILEGTSTCTGDNYDFSGYAVSASVTQLDAVTHNVNCVLLNSAAGNVSVELPNDLESAEHNTIPASGFVFTTTAGTVDGSLAADTPESTASEFHSAPKTLYHKDQYKVGNLTNLPLTLDGEVPGGTPKGVYSAELDITFGS